MAKAPADVKAATTTKDAAKGATDTKAAAPAKQ
jgi:hypothetical protein